MWPGPSSYRPVSGVPHVTSSWWTCVPSNLTQDTCLYLKGQNVCPVAWESYDARLRCGPDKVVLSNSSHFDLWGTGLGPVCDKPPYDGEHVRLRNPMMHGWDVSRTRYSPIKQYSFWPLTSKCNLDIWGTCLGLVRDTPPHYGQRLCQVSLKSYNAWLKCGPDNVQSYQTVLILTFDL